MNIDNNEPKRPRIFIAMHYLELGGAERSLIGLLEALDKSRFDVDLFIYSHQGDLMGAIPQDVNLLPEEPAYTALERPIKDIVKEGHWRIAWGRLKAKWAFGRYMKRTGAKDGSAIFQYVADYTTLYLPSLKKYGRYDLAISFLTPHNIVRDKVDARHKLAWIHTDYSTIEVDAPRELKVWMAYDRIVSISPDVSKAFLKTFPKTKDKLIIIENILSPAAVRHQAEGIDVSAEMPREQGVVNLCSVGRFSEAKNFDNVPDICRRLLAEGVRLRWYIIGFGGAEALIRQRIAEAGMEEHVILLGKKANPYPYIAAADVYVQPSRYEGKAVTVREAQILGRPVVITAFPTAPSQVTDGKDGLIVPLDNAGCARELAAFLQDPVRRQTMQQYVATHDFGNESEARKVEEWAEKP